MLSVYAILDAEPNGVSGMRFVDCGGILAAVKETDKAPPMGEQALREYDKTVRELAGMVEAILPARFGSVVDNEAALLAALKDRKSELRNALDLVRGREQMTLRLFGENTEPVADDASGPGTRYLNSKMRIPGLDGIRAKVSSFVRAERVERLNKPPLLASVFHLIDRNTSAAYVEALADMPRIATSGPWPPYAFGRWDIPREIRNES